MTNYLVLQAVEASGLAGLRPSWCLAAASGAGAAGWVDLPEGFAFLGSWPVFGVLVAVAVFEHLAERDVDLTRLIYTLRLGLTAGAAWVSQGTMAAFGEQTPTWVQQAGGIALAVVVALLRAEVRRRTMDATEDVGDPAKWIARGEELTLVVGAVLLLFAPIVLLVLLVLMVLGAAALLVMARLIERRFRRACPSCGEAARKEAQRCPGCGGSLVPERWLGLSPRLDERLRQLAAGSRERSESALQADASSG